MPRRLKPFEVEKDIFWYLVGIITSDECLSPDGRHIDITLKDKDHLTKIRNAIRSRAKVTRKRGGYGNGAYHIQLGSRVLYTRLLEIGLTPKKSLTLGPLRVSDHNFSNFLRGVIDGNGNIHRWIHPTNGHEQWVLRVYGASEPFMKWVQDVVKRLWKVGGQLHKDSNRQSPNTHPLYILKYGKLAARAILAINLMRWP